MSYTDTFIEVAVDCPVDHGVVPVARGEHKPIHVLQYELLSAHPYTFTHEDLLFKVYVRHQAIPADELRARGAELRAALLARSHPCLRASLLPKRYGWGIHYDSEGKIALYARDSDEYRQFVQDTSGTPKLLAALRNKRAPKPA